MKPAHLWLTFTHLFVSNIHTPRCSWPPGDPKRKEKYTFFIVSLNQTHNENCLSFGSLLFVCLQNTVKMFGDVRTPAG